MCVPLYVICGCLLVSLSLVGCLFAKFTLLSIKRRMISFVFTSKQSGIYFFTEARKSFNPQLFIRNFSSYIWNSLFTQVEHVSYFKNNVSECKGN